MADREDAPAGLHRLGYGKFLSITVLGGSESLSDQGFWIELSTIGNLIPTNLDDNSYFKVEIKLQLKDDVNMQLNWLIFDHFRSKNTKNVYKKIEDRL